MGRSRVPRTGQPAHSRLYRQALTLVGFGLLGCDDATPRLATFTVALPAPELSYGAFEPHVAVDPDRPDRVVVAAQYGAGYNRGGKKIWSWTTEDAGHTWTSGEMPPPGKTAIAADAVTAFGTDGRAFLTFLYADSAFRGGAAFARTAPNRLRFDPASRVVPDRLDLGGGAVDKGWLAVDRGPLSPFKGVVYLSWHYNRPLPNREVESTLWVISGRDRGRQWSEPTLIAPHFGGQLAIRSDGTLDAVFVGRDGRLLMHASSEDGGRSFGMADAVTTVGDSITIDLPTLTVARGDTLVLCWSEGPSARSEGYAVRCARQGGQAGWTINPVADPALPGAAMGFPALAANAGGVWLTAYVADSASVSVRLYRSADAGRTFIAHSTLATRPFGLAGFCVASSAPCRRSGDPATVFFPGDYIGLAAAPDRVVAAFTLPGTDDPGSRSTAYVSIVRF